jgi:transcription elongation factor
LPASASKVWLTFTGNQACSSSRNTCPSTDIGSDTIASWLNGYKRPQGCHQQTARLRVSSFQLTGDETAWQCSHGETQNNSELELRHWKNGRKDGKGEGSKTAKSLSQHVQCNWKHFPPFNFDTICGISIHWLLHHPVFCEPKEL